MANEIERLSDDVAASQWGDISKIIFLNSINHGRSVDESVGDVHAAGCAVAGGSASVWIVHERGDCAGVQAMCCTIDDGDGLRVFSMVGKRPREWARDLSDSIAAFAKGRGMSFVRYTGPRAWTRLLPEFKLSSTDGASNTYERVV